MIDQRCIRPADLPELDVRYCLSCGSSTEFGKPYCARHVEEMPYVSELIGQLTGQAPSCDAA